MTNPVVEAILQVNAEAGPERPIPLPWPRLSKCSRFLQPGLSVIGSKPGTGKSFLALAILIHCVNKSIPTAYMPLESKRAFHVRRAAAIMDNSFDSLTTVEDDERAPEIATSAIKRVSEQLKPVAERIEANPCLPQSDGFMQDVGASYVLDWLQSRFSAGVRVAIIDPFVMIDFQGRDAWQAENAFIKSCVSLAAHYCGTVVLVAHTTKKTDTGGMLEIGDLQGGASLGRLASSIILMKSHEPKESTVFRTHGLRERVTHNRTFIVAKSRNGMEGAPLAFNFGLAGPVFDELGVMAPRD